MKSMKSRMSVTFIDEIDPDKSGLAIHYGFTPVELDSTINYDMKYRMAKELGEEE